MTHEELLKPRYQVIADYPGNGVYKVGEIITVGIHGDLIYCDENGPRLSQYPHLFKKLEWWEERKPENMPEYVWTITNRIAKVKKWIGVPFLVADLGTHFTNARLLCPATREEYEQYQLSKTK